MQQNLRYALKLEFRKKRREWKKKILKFSFQSLLQSFTRREEKRKKIENFLYKSFFLKMRWLEENLSHSFSIKKKLENMLEKFFYFLSLPISSLPFSSLLKTRNKILVLSSSHAFMYPFHFWMSLYILKINKIFKIL